MGEIKGTNIIGAITPFTTDDTYPTHYAKYGHGGYRTVGAIDEMNSIPEARCENGMLVYVTEEDRIYKYNDTDKKFYELALGGSYMLPKTVYTSINKTNPDNPILTAYGFDDIKTPGVYFLGAGYNQSPGILYVVSANDKNEFVFQTYISFLFADCKFNRTYTKSNWSEWEFSLDETGTDGEYTGGTNIDITDNTISAKGYTYNDDKNFYIGNEATYTEITDLTWNNVPPEGDEEPIRQTIYYDGTDPDFDFNNIIKKDDSIRFYDTENDASFVFKVTVVNDNQFNINGFCRIHPNNTKVQKIDNGVTFLAKNDGDVYVKGIGNYNGADTNTDTCDSLQDAFNEMNSNLEELSNSLNSTTYTAGDNIYISASGMIGAKGYSYVNENDGMSIYAANVRELSVEDGFISEGFSTFKNNIVITNSDNTVFTTINANTGEITTPGKINAAQGFYETSDIRKKNVIDELPLDKAYELINNCQSIIYTLKDNTDKQQIGLIAQEVQQYFPEVVSEDKDGYLSLDYAKLTSVIFRVLKDVIDRLNKLENK